MMAMISDDTIDRFYYIFDSREQRALVLDRTTGEEMAWRAVPRVQLLEHVERERAASVLRPFARWCARQVNVAAAPDSSPTARLWKAAQQDEEEKWRHERAEATDAVVEAAALGLPQGRSDAAQLLVAHACTHPDARRAAIDAAHMTERWAEFEAGTESAAAVRRMRQQHIDWLLDVLNRAA